MFAALPVHRGLRGLGHAAGVQRTSRALGPSWFAGCPGPRSPLNLQCARAQSRERCQGEEYELCINWREEYITSHLTWGPPDRRRVVVIALIIRDACRRRAPPPKAPGRGLQRGRRGLLVEPRAHGGEAGAAVREHLEDFTSALASAACRSAVVPSSAQKGHGASADVCDVAPPRQPHAAAAAFNAGAVHTRPPVVGSTYCGICRDTAASWSRARTVSIDMRRRRLIYLQIAEDDRSLRCRRRAAQHAHSSY